MYNEIYYITISIYIYVHLAIYIHPSGRKSFMLPCVLTWSLEIWSPHGVHSPVLKFVKEQWLFAQQTFIVKYLPIPHFIFTRGKQQSTCQISKRSNEEKMATWTCQHYTHEQISRKRRQWKSWEKQESVFIILLLPEQQPTTRQAARAWAHLMPTPSQRGHMLDCWPYISFLRLVLHSSPTGCSSDYHIPATWPHFWPQS